MINTEFELYVDIIYKEYLPLLPGEYLQVTPNKLSHKTLINIKYHSNELATNPNDHKADPQTYDPATDIVYKAKDQVAQDRPYVIIVWSGKKEYLTKDSKFRIVSLQDLELLITSLNVTYKKTKNNKSTKKQYTYKSNYSLKHRKIDAYSSRLQAVATKTDLQYDLDDSGINYKTHINKPSRKYKKPSWEEYVGDYYVKQAKETSWKSNTKQPRQWAKHKTGPQNLTKPVAQKSRYPHLKLDTIEYDGENYFQNKTQLKVGDLVFSPTLPEEGVYLIKLNHAGKLCAYRNDCIAEVKDMKPLTITKDPRVNWDEWENVEFMNNTLYTSAYFVYPQSLGEYCWLNWKKEHQPYYPSY